MLIFLSYYVFGFVVFFSLRKDIVRILITKNNGKTTVTDKLQSNLPFFIFTCLIVAPVWPKAIYNFFFDSTWKKARNEP